VVVHACKYEASLGYMVSSRLAWAKQQDPVSKHQKRKERK
jgi:hypothetical protein